MFESFVAFFERDPTASEPMNLILESVSGVIEQELDRILVGVVLAVATMILFWKIQKVAPIRTHDSTTPETPGTPIKEEMLDVELDATMRD
ncbi:hypothetical protein F5878DRAFT_667874 [Lentinula raphanica]|uniref:Uncharacterized protein n=1 Tax=Lentinula raphanica TaxID=153919 RepID=A0AA38NV32_9AGAR|nr:hypothetical protein C8R42DRAFT_729003 [Lentinula raphanica]KAJ3831142.1 hypothetical protein F5878DRAFT_667874 [Lentinula raphanica]